ncbi:MAG TPA: zinc ribbon domain-containing protein [candidate division Zixibacteria bacterium]|nr:zinc ribbon domain-containing protein [candidate division Zixibacteria bacterium]
MSFPAILIGLAFLLVTIPIVAKPLQRKKRPNQSNGENNTRGSQRGYKQILLALRDLDFDHQLGVVTESDYQQNRAILLAEAAEACEEPMPVEGDLSQLIEAAVGERRKHHSNGHSQCAGCGADIKPGDKYCPACGLSALNTCPHCHQPIEQEDNFCTSCGAQTKVAIGVAV